MQKQLYVFGFYRLVYAHNKIAEEKRVDFFCHFICQNNLRCETRGQYLVLHNTLDLFSQCQEKQ